MKKMQCLQLPHVNWEHLGLKKLKTSSHELKGLLDECYPNLASPETQMCGFCLFVNKVNTDGESSKVCLGLILHDSSIDVEAIDVGDHLMFTVSGQLLQEFRGTKTVQKTEDENEDDKKFESFHVNLIRSYNSANSDEEPVDVTTEYKLTPGCPSEKVYSSGHKPHFWISCGST